MANIRKISEKKSKALLPLVCSAGGKYWVRKRIIERIPPHETYVEPFFGGGSVFWGKPPAKRNVINDTDKQLMAFYRNLNCRKLKVCVSNEKEKSERSWKTRKKRVVRGSNDSCDYYLVRSLSYGCKVGKSNFSHTQPERKIGTRKIVSNCEEYKRRLSNTKIHSKDWKDILQKYDGVDTFFYLDPPFDGVSEANDFYKGQNVSPKDICPQLKEIKGKFILSYNDHPEIKKACSSFHQTVIVENKCFASHGSKRVGKTKQFLISNFPVRGSRKIV